MVGPASSLLTFQLCLFLLSLHCCGSILHNAVSPDSKHLIYINRKLKQANLRTNRPVSFKIGLWCSGAGQHLGMIQVLGYHRLCFGGVSPRLCVFGNSAVRLDQFKRHGMTVNLYFFVFSVKGCP